MAEIYKKLGDDENYYATILAIRDTEAEFNQAVKKEYLEFSQYYKEAKMLTKENEALYEAKANGRDQILA